MAELNIVDHEEEVTHELSSMPKYNQAQASSSSENPKESSKSPGKFRKTHRRNESKLSRISHLSIRSLRGNTLEEDDEPDGDGENKKPIYLFHSLTKICPCMPTLSLPGYLRLSNLRKRVSQYLIDHKKYDDRIFVVGNKFSEHLYRELNIDLKKVQTKFARGRTPNKFITSKYTLLTFIPLNLYEQFRRIASIYFLLSLILALALQELLPLSPMSWLLSVLFVIVVTMLKQGYEDYLRHKSDLQINKRAVHVLRNGQLKEIHAEDIVVGDIVYLSDNAMIPCDLIILSTSLDHGHCYTMTANLDGETSLKTKVASPLTKNIRTIEEVDRFVGCIQYENPNPKLGTFLGRMFSFGELNNHIETCSLSAENMLLSGAQLKNTREVFGVCVYGGKQTKIYLNSLMTHNKFSSIERALNRFLIAYVFIMAALMAFSTTMSFHEGVEYYNSSSPEKNETLKESSNYHWYLPEPIVNSNIVEGLKMVFIWNSLYNFLIPISLYVCIEIMKFIGSRFVAWDQELFDEASNKPPTVRTSDINEELGLVTHLFCDKTGTLTQNIMIFRQYSQNGQKFDYTKLSEEHWNLFLMGMTLCHSVQYTSGHFVASSPDEQAIVEVCNWAGFSFWGEELDGTVTVSAKDQIHTYKKLAELQFDSFRKCMSVIVRPKFSSEDAGKETIYLFVKGAETAVLPNCTSGPTEETRLIVDQFARDGLRTLVYAYKELSREELNIFSEKLEAARQSIVNRIKYVRDVYREMEKNLILLGATGIEDKLQDHVVQTLDKMQRAGITTWMLTGDKKETALNMALASGMIKSSQKQIDLCEVLDKKSLYALVDDVYQNPLDWSFPASYLVLDGKSIAAILKGHDCKSKFCRIATKCHSIIACRLSPVQKSQLVTMIKEANTSNVTCAIGDGGNDVSMIQEAHVGLGIIGREGSAASQSADFAITKFHHLQRLLLVHGHWNYTRQAFMVQYSFYKNLACFLGHLYFAFYSNFSGNTFYDSTYILMYNTLYTLLPVMVYGLTEQRYPSQQLLEQPELYKQNRGNHLMSTKWFFRWCLLGIWHSVCSVFPWIFMWDIMEKIHPQGHGLTSLGFATAGTVCTIVNLKVLLEARYWSWLLVLSVFSSIGFFIIITVIFNVIPLFPDSALASNYEPFYGYVMLFDQTALMNVAVVILSVISALLPDCFIIVMSDIMSKMKHAKKVIPA